MKSTVVTVTTAPTLLLDGGGQALVAMRSGSILNNSATVLYIGGADVTADTAAGTGGYPISTAGLVAYDAELLPGDKLYGVVAASTLAVNVIRNGE